MCLTVHWNLFYCLWFVIFCIWTEIQIGTGKERRLWEVFQWRFIHFVEHPSRWQGVAIRRSLLDRKREHRSTPLVIHLVACLFDWCWWLLLQFLITTHWFLIAAWLVAPYTGTKLFVFIYKHYQTWTTSTSSILLKVSSVNTRTVHGNELI